jgi:hypothetical protein
MTATKTLLGIALGVSIAGMAVAQDVPRKQDAARTTSTDQDAKVPAASQDTAMARLDTDKDGRVSSSEASADPTFDSGFAAMDADGDGYVTNAEFHERAKATSKPKKP